VLLHEWFESDDGRVSIATILAAKIGRAFRGTPKMLRVAFVLFLLLLPSVAHAEKCVALVIGNSAYQHTPQLTNPKNDAAAMSAALKKLSFQASITRSGPTRAGV
jgi:Caspase domain